jgi:hypothetical protein
MVFTPFSQFTFVKMGASEPNDHRMLAMMRLYAARATNHFVLGVMFEMLKEGFICLDSVWVDEAGR